MNKFEFRVILNGPIELTEEVADGLFAAGCDDGSPGMCNGEFSIDFHRKADSLESALRSALQNIAIAGYTVQQIQLQPNDFMQPT